MVLTNPWDVLDASLFLKYCCPECNHQSKELDNFTEHALRNHELSKILFDDKTFEQDGGGDTEIKTEPVVSLDSAIGYESPTNDDLFPDDIGDDDDYQYDVKDEDEDDEDYNDFSEYTPPRKKARKARTPKSSRRVKSEEDFLDDDLKPINLNKKKKRQKGLAKPDSDGWTRCEYCPDKKFLFVFELLEHMTESHGGERYVTFPLSSVEIVAKDAKLAENNWQCAICDSDEKYQFKSQLVMHWYNNHAKENYPYDACQWCMEIFDSWESILKHHEKVHPDLPKREYPCTVSECYHSGAELSRLAKHYKRHEVPYTLPIKCNICSDSFIIEEALLYHLKTEHSKEIEPQQCSACPMAFLSESNKVIHLSMHGLHDELQSKFLCKYCLGTCTSEVELARHYKQYHEFENLPYYVCEKCEYFSDKFTDTEEHCKTVHGMDRYCCFTCKHCEYIGNEIGAFRRHVVTHIDVSHVCDECGEVLKSKKSLKRHKEYNHAKQNERCVCDFCGFSTTHQDWLKRHILNRHTKGKTVICPHCQKSFRDKNCLEVHLDNNHPGTNEKKFFCQECGSGFMYQYSLTSHLYKHKIKLKKIAERNENLKNKPTGPMKCPQCDKMLNGQDNLKRHITQSHTKVTCSQCQKSLLNKFQLKKHLFFDHGHTDGAFLCSLCPEQVFFSKLTYTKHMQKAHAL